MNNTEELNNTVDDILSQLKQVPATVKKAQTVAVTRENLEQFILDNASKLITTASEAMQEVKDFVSTAPDADSVEALASLVNANATALETLNRLLIAGKRNETVLKVKQMDVDSRKEQLDTAIGARLVLTREELLKNLVAPTKPVQQVQLIEAEYTITPSLSN